MSVFVLMVTAAAAFAQGQATVLEPISPLGAEPPNLPPVMTVNSSGHVMAAWAARRGETRLLVSGYNPAGGWQIAEIAPPPELRRGWYDSDIEDLAWWGEKFALLVNCYGHSYAYVWSNGAWGAPLELPDNFRASRLNFDAAGNLVAFSYSTS